MGKINKYLLGALIGRVEGGTDFLVADNLTYTSPVSGRLILYPNRGNYAHLIAYGELTVSVDGGKLVSEEEAEKLSGWDLSKLDLARDVDYLTDAEKDVILLLNKARSNPPLFAKQYLTAKKGQGGYALECYNEMLETAPLSPLLPSRALSLAARDHAIDTGKNGTAGHVSTNGDSSTDRVKRYGTFTGTFLGPWENCSYGHEDPIGIMLQLLIDDGVPSRGHRKNILQKNTGYVGVSIQPHKTYGTTCVQDFADSIEDK